MVHQNSETISRYIFCIVDGNDEDFSNLIEWIVYIK